jgi:hypothetical protein
MPPKVTRAKP